MAQATRLGGTSYEALTWAPRVSYVRHQSVAGMSGYDGSDGRDESEPQLEFTPKEVRMSTVSTHVS